MYLQLLLSLSLTVSRLNSLLLNSHSYHMMPKLSLEESSRLVGQLEAGISPTKVAGIFGVNKTTVYRIKAKFDEDGSVKRRRGSGRPRKTTKQEDDAIVEAHEDDRFRTPTETAEGTNVSARTVKRRLYEQGLKARKPALKPRLTEHHKNARMQWAVTHRRWTVGQWSNILFTDEASFSVSNKDRRFYCYRRRNERYLESTVRESINRGYGCVSVWAGIHHDRKLPLVRVDGRLNGQVYVDRILTQQVIPYIRNNRRVILQQDNALQHRGRIAAEYLRLNNVTVLEWPAISPDMNCIESLWAVLSRALRRRKPQPLNADELFNFLNEEWNRIPDEVVLSHTTSMRSRVDQLWRVQGGHTKY